MKKKSLLALSCMFIIGIFIGCSGSKEITEEYSKSDILKEVIEEEKIEMLDAEYKKIKDSDINKIEKIESECKEIKNTVEVGASEGLVIKSDGEIIDTIEIEEDGNSILEYEVNDDFIVWIESNWLGGGDQSFEKPDLVQWAVYYKEIGANEVKNLEKNKYPRIEELNVSDGLELDGDNLVYRTYVTIDEKLYPNIVSCNLKSNEKIFITNNSKEKNEGYIMNSISGNNIVYTSGKNSENGLVDESVVMYNIETKEKSVIIDEVGIGWLDLKNNKVAVNVTTLEGESMYYYDIEENKIYNLFYEGSKIREKFEFEDIKGFENMTFEFLSDNYLRITVSGKTEMLLYDFKNNEFLDVSTVAFDNPKLQVHLKCGNLRYSSIK